MAYTGNLNQIPAGWYLCDGANGTPDLRDRFLEGSGKNAVWSYIAPGLPNITGHENINICNYADGAFNINYYYNAGWGYYEGYQLAENIAFDASRSSKLYGASDTVQPAAYTVYFIIRLR